jgi:hypothetical protein
LYSKKEFISMLKILSFCEEGKGIALNFHENSFVVVLSVLNGGGILVLFIVDFRFEI